MLKIDCLLKNTDVAETVRSIIGYLGHKWLAEDKSVAFEGMYRYLREQGVEVDKETAAKIYADEMNLSDARYTSQADLDSITGAWKEKALRAILLQDANKKMMQIGELSPAKAVAKSIADSFTSGLAKSESTKTMLKELEDIGVKAAKRILGEKPEADRSDKRTSEEIITAALEKELLGHKDKNTQMLLGLPRLWDEARNVIKEMSSKIGEEADPEMAEAWEKYVKDFEDASYTLALSSKEAQTVFHEALMDKGFIKTTKSGKEILDWKALASNLNSYQDLRENVISALTDKGFTQDIAERVADTLHKEFKEARGKMLEINERRESQVAQTWADVDAAIKETLPELVDRRVKEWKNLTKFEGHENDPLAYTLMQTKKVIGDALKNNDQYGMEWGVDKRAIDWVALSGKVPDKEALRDIIHERLVTEGVKEKSAMLTAEAMAESYHDRLLNEIETNARRILDTKQVNLERYKANRKTELERLAELHDLGIFNNAHDRLLAKVLGIAEGDIDAMNDIKEFAGQMSALRNIMSGNEFTAATRQREIAREIQNITARAVGDKSKALRMANILNKIYQVENAGLVSGYKNLIENHMSGIMEYATTKVNAKLKLGNKLAGNKKELRKLMADTWAFIAGGGTEIGLAPYMVGGTQERVMDKYNLHKLKGMDWRSPKNWARGVASVAFTVPRAFLAATDGMFKISNYRLHFLIGMHDALVGSGNYTHEEAVNFLNEAFYGKQKIEAARNRAMKIYQETGVSSPSRRQINITANDLLLENLINEDIMKPDALKEIHESAFKMAGLGMGHESNNIVSEHIQSSKIKLQQKEQAAFNSGDYTRAAKIRTWNTAINSVIMRFAASQFNWAWIKMEQSGVGILSGVYHYREGKRLKSKQLLSSEDLIKSSEEYQKARQSMARGVMGLAANALLTNVAMPLIANELYPDDEDAVETMFQDLGDSYIAKAMFIKTAPLWLLGDFLYHQKKTGDKEAALVGGLVENLTGLGGNKSTAVIFHDASKKIGSNNPSVQDKGWAQIGSWMGGNFPKVPFYKQGKDVLQTVNLFGDAESPEKHYPRNFWQGFLGGGMVQDLSETLPEDYRPEWMDRWWGNSR